MFTKFTPAEIKKRMGVVLKDDWMRTQISDLLDYLPFEDAKEFLKPDVTKEQWDARTVRDPLDEVKEYLRFAWGKANDCRGLSAGRSLDHLKAWLWLAGYGDLVDEHFKNYTHYGKKQLVIASVLTGFDWKAVDNGLWVRDEGAPSLPPERIAEEVAEATSIAIARRNN